MNQTDSLETTQDTSVGEGVLYDIFYGMIPRYVLITAEELGLFEYLSETGREREKIQEHLGISARSAQSVLSVLQSLELLKVVAGKYHLTPVTRKYFLRDSPFYSGRLGKMFQVIEKVYSFEAVRKLILTDEKHIDIFDLARQTDEFAGHMTETMHNMSFAPSKWWVEAIDLSAHTRLLDIAGGSGAHAITAMQKWPQLEATVLDMETVLPHTEEYFSRFGLNGRGKTVQYDLWEGELPPADVHFYSNIFHDWSYEQGQFLAEKSFHALEPGGKIIIHEMLYDDDKSGPPTIANYNFAMFATMEGQQYSGPELRSLLGNAGFTDIEVIPTQAYWSIVTGTKPGEKAISL